MTTSQDTERKQKILWAVDAFPDSVDVQAQAGRAVRTLLEKLPASVEPVYVARPAPPGLFIQEDPTVDMGFSKQARKNLNWLARLVALPNVAPPHFLCAQKPTVSSQVKCLLEYAVEGGFDTIVVGTHSRKGAARLFLGSFAERLILESPIPVLVTNTKASLRMKKKLQHILFPTDFSDESYEVFKKSIGLAKQLNAKMVLLHQEVLPYIPATYPMLVPPIPDTMLEEIHADMKKKGAKWEQEANRAGVSTKFFLREPGISAATAVIEMADELPSCLIAMASRSGKIESMLLGSLTRQVIRAAKCPVYVFHPEALRKATSKEAFRLSEDDIPGPRKVLLT